MRVIITGASKGLGRVLAEEFSRCGHAVGLVARSSDSLDTIATELNSRPPSQGRAYARPCNLLNEDEVTEAFALLIDDLKGVDALINCAGHIAQRSITQISSDDWQRALTTSVSAAFHATRAVLPHFLAQGAGHIINISSLSTKIPLERGIAYATSKHALNGFSTSLVHELHSQGIKVCTIYPGAFAVPGTDAPAWKMPASEVFRACEYVLNAHPKAFVEELTVRPIDWPE